MLTTVDLYDQRGLETAEVGDIASERMLEAELAALDLTIAHGLPEDVLRISSLASEPSGMAADLTTDRIHPVKVEEERPSPNPLPRKRERASRKSSALLNLRPFPPTPNDGALETERSALGQKSSHPAFDPIADNPANDVSRCRMAAERGQHAIPD